MLQLSLRDKALNGLASLGLSPKLTNSTGISGSQLKISLPTRQSPQRPRLPRSLTPNHKPLFFSKVDETVPKTQQVNLGLVRELNRLMLHDKALNGVASLGLSPTVV